MQLTNNELSKAINSVNKEAYFLKNDKRVLVVDISAGELKFSIDLSRLSPFLLEYLCYYPNEDDRYKNIEYNNFYKYGTYWFISNAFAESGEYPIQTFFNHIRSQNAEFNAWCDNVGSSDKFEAYLAAGWTDVIMSGFMAWDRENLDYNDYDYIFYTLRDAASKASGIDLSDIEPPH